MTGFSPTESTEALRRQREEPAETRTADRFRRLAVLKPWLWLAAGLVMAAMALFALHHLSEELDYNAVATALAAKSWGTMAAAVLAAALSYAAMMGYDLSAVRHVGPVPPVPRRIAALASFCGFALSNSMGVGAFTGSAVRWRIYAAAGVDPKQIARMLVFVTVSFSLGIFFAAALGVLLAATHMAEWFGLTARWLRVSCGTGAGGHGRRGDAGAVAERPYPHRPAEAAGARLQADPGPGANLDCRSRRGGGGAVAAVADRARWTCPPSSPCMSSLSPLVRPAICRVALACSTRWC
jgi:hypothetical protein